MMGKPRPLYALGLAAVLAATATGWTAATLASDIVIGVGFGARVHFGVGRAVCRHVQRTLPGTTCEVLRIEGRDAAEPLAVLGDVGNNSIEVGLVQSDWQHHAVQGTGPVAFMDVKFDNLRSLFSLHGEPFTVVARRDAKIGGLDDLAGKRVNIGNPGSSQRVIMELVMKAKGWTRKTFDLADELSEAEQSLALCHNRVQAIVSTVAHPNAATAKAIDLCHAEIVEIAGAEIDALVAGNRFLAITEVPAGLYADMAAPVRTFGVMVTAVTSADIDDELAYSIVSSVFDNLDDLKKLHPALGSLAVDRMMADGLSAPLHPGALRYFRERGMM
jgi:TRAP transporter TAXI family solute receptor